MADNEVINKIIETILVPIMAMFKFLIKIIFLNHAVSLLFFFIVVNLLAVLLMKRDKMYAENGERRIRESTLLVVALVGGSIGMYFAMYKYKHKTLHKKFTILVPTFIVLHFLFLTYSIVNCFIG